MEPGAYNLDKREAQVTTGASNIKIRMNEKPKNGKETNIAGRNTLDLYMIPRSVRLSSLFEPEIVTHQGQILVLLEEGGASRSNVVASANSRDKNA